MKKTIEYLSYCFILCHCNLFEKEELYHQDIQTQKNFSKKIEKPSSREINYLKNLSQTENNDFKFINQQIKNILKKYKKINQKLNTMESKINQILKQQSLLDEQKKNIAKPFETEFDILKTEDLEDVEDLLPKEKNEDQDLPEKELFPQDEESREELLIPKAEDFEHGQLIKKHLKSKQKLFSHFINGKKLFKKKSYKKAIAEFQKYRNQIPKESHYFEATFYIGEAFKNLKMPIEANIFFKEIITNHPESLWALRAKNQFKE